MCNMVKCIIIPENLFKQNLISFASKMATLKRKNEATSTKMGLASNLILTLTVTLK